MVEKKAHSTLQIIFKNRPVLFCPYTGWFSGKSVKDGRGIKNLLIQLRNEPRI